MTTFFRIYFNKVNKINLFEIYDMKQFIYIFALLVCFIPCQGQKKLSADSISTMNIKIGNEPRFYLNIHGGYAFSLGSSFKFFPDNISSISVNQVQNNPVSKDVKFKDESKGLGDGFRFGIGLSYIINDFINVGLDVDYSQSTLSKTKDSSFMSKEEMNGNVDQLIYNEKYTISYDATLLTFSPNITFKAISQPKFFIYNKVGAIIIFRPNSIQLETRQGDYKMGWQGFFRDSSLSETKKYEWGLKNPAFGFMGAIGGQVKLTERTRLFAEVQFTHVLFKVRNRILTNYTMDGQEMINTLPISAKETIFKKSFSSDDLSNDPNQPNIDVYQKFPITYVGLQVGIAYRF